MSLSFDGEVEKECVGTDKRERVSTVAVEAPRSRKKAGPENDGCLKMTE